MKKVLIIYNITTILSPDVFSSLFSISRHVVHPYSLSMLHMTSDNIVVIQADKLEPETKEKEEHERAVLLTLRLVTGSS